jgi:hypothetical protein
VQQAAEATGHVDDGAGLREVVFSTRYSNSGFPKMSGNAVVPLATVSSSLPAGRQYTSSVSSMMTWRMEIGESDRSSDDAVVRWKAPVSSSRKTFLVAR